MEIFILKQGFRLKIAKTIVFLFLKKVVYLRDRKDLFKKW